MLGNTVPVTMTYKPVQESSATQNTQYIDNTNNRTKSCKEKVSKENSAAKPDGGAASYQLNELEVQIE